MFDPSAFAAAIRASCVVDSGTNSAVPDPTRRLFNSMNSPPTFQQGFPVVSSIAHQKVPQMDNASAANGAAMLLSSLLAANGQMCLSPGVQRPSVADLMNQNPNAQSLHHNDLASRLAASLFVSGTTNGVPTSALSQFGADSASATAARHPSRFYKTKICPYLQQKGKCSKGYKCVYAHSLSELRGLPNLEKTKLCPSYKSEGTCTNPKCSFAHTMEELRHTDNFYKTKLCHMWKKGKCSAGNFCRHAHGPEELNWFRSVARQTSPPTTANGTVSTATPTRTGAAPSYHRHVGIPQFNAQPSFPTIDDAALGVNMTHNFDQHGMQSALSPFFQALQQLQNDSKQQHQPQHPGFPTLYAAAGNAQPANSADSQLMNILKLLPQQILLGGVHEPAHGNPQLAEQLDAASAAMALLNLSAASQQPLNSQEGATQIPNGNAVSTGQAAPVKSVVDSLQKVDDKLGQIVTEKTNLNVGDCRRSCGSPPDTQDVCPMASGGSVDVRGRSGDSSHASAINSAAANSGKDGNQASDQSATPDVIPTDFSTQSSEREPNQPSSLNSGVQTETKPNVVDPQILTANAKVQPLQLPQPSDLQAAPLSDAARYLHTAQIIKALQDQLSLFVQYNPYVDPSVLTGLLASQHLNLESSATNAMQTTEEPSHGEKPTTSEGTTIHNGLLTEFGSMAKELLANPETYPTSPESTSNSSMPDSKISNFSTSSESPQVETVSLRDGDVSLFEKPGNSKQGASLIDFSENTTAASSIMQSDGCSASTCASTSRASNSASVAFASSPMGKAMCDDKEDEASDFGGLN